MSEDSKQLSVAELLARNGQQGASWGRGRPGRPPGPRGRGGGPAAGQAPPPRPARRALPPDPYSFDCLSSRCIG